MLRAQKDQSIAMLQAALGSAAGAFFVDFTGMTVAEADRLRRGLKDSSLRYLVVKNSLAARAMAGTPFAAAAAALPGSPTGLIWGEQDAVAVAKAVFAFAGECEHVKVKGGIVEAEVVDAQQALALSTSPTRGELQAGIAVVAQAPGHQLMRAVASAGGNIVGAIAALCERLDPDAAPAGSEPS